MKERRFLWIFAVVTACLIPVLGGIWSPGPAGADTINLTYANFPPASTFPCVQMERWVKEVEKRTNGKVKVKTFPGSTLLGAKNMFDGVVKGVADIGCLATAYQPGRFKLFEAMDLPGEFPSGAVASVVMWELYSKFKPKSFKDVKVLTMFTCATTNIMSTKAVRNLKDLQGMKLRATGTGVKIMKLLGAAPEGMPMSAVPEALQKGVVSGLVSSLEVMKDFKFAEYCKFITVADLWVVPFAVVMNKKKWESLPADVKKVFNGLSKEQAIWTGKYVDKHAEEAVAWSKAKENVEVIKLTKEQRAKWMSKVAGLREEYIKRTEAAGLPAKAFLKDLEKLKAQYIKEMK
ncbi:MAG: TRAP transporter substrate-binding protein [Deltaproteobacteria bacterium]